MIDNGPDPDTEKVAREMGARYVAEPRRGYGCARNRGIAEARGEVLYFLDDDCVAEPDWAERLWDALASGRADLAGGSRVSGRTGLAARLEYLSTDGPVLSPRLPAGPVRHLSTSNLIFKREVVDRTGPLRREARHVRGSRFHRARARRGISPALRAGRAGDALFERGARAAITSRGCGITASERPSISR